MSRTFRFELERDELNQRLGEGFPEGSIVLIEGENGAGKSTIAERLAYGFLSNGHSTTFISTQLTTKSFINQMYSLDYPIGLNLLKDELLFIAVTPLIKSAKSRSDFIERLINAEKLYDKDVIIIDKISELVKYSINPEKSIELVSFFKKITGMGKIVIITIDPVDLDSDIVSLLRSSADIYMTLKSRVVAGEVKRSINVNKFTGAKGFVGGVIGFRIEPGAGLVIEIASVA
ncbi:MAG: archaellum protein ArlH [Candidatus Syntropharchaeales archaeon]